MPFALNDRVRLSIAIALTSADRDTIRRQQLESDAIKLGLTGAEIDAARFGRSFDVQTSVAIALAVAAYEGDRSGADAARARARRFGIEEGCCDEIEALASCRSSAFGN